MMYMTFATIFIAQAYGIHLSLGQEITMLLVLMVTSKGMAGVPRASLVVIAAIMPLFKIPEAGLLLILAVDHFLDMGRSATNVVGNAVASSVVARWEGELNAEEPADIEPRHAPAHVPSRDPFVAAPEPIRDPLVAVRAAVAVGRYGEAADLAAECGIAQPLRAEAHYLHGLALGDFDLPQADVREVVGLDGRTETVVDLLDLGQHMLRLCLLGGDRPGRGVRGCRRTQQCENGRTGEAGTASNHRRRKRTPKANAERLRLSFPAAGHQHAEDPGRRAHRRGPVRHKWGTLAASSDVCNRFPSLKVTISPMCEYRTKS